MDEAFNEFLDESLQRIKAEYNVAAKKHIELNEEKDKLPDLFEMKRLIESIEIAIRYLKCGE